MDFTLTNVFSTMISCWEGMGRAVLSLWNSKYKRKEKLFGVFPQRVVQKNPCCLEALMMNLCNIPGIRK